MGGLRLLPKMRPYLIFAPGRMVLELEGSSSYFSLQHCVVVLCGVSTYDDNMDAKSQFYFLRCRPSFMT